VFIPIYRKSPTSQLLHNDGDGQWTRIPLGATLQTATGMWGDYDNDGDLDLFITRGQVTPTVNLFFANNGDGTFSQLVLGTVGTEQSLSSHCAWADYDNDGFLDLFVTRFAGYPDVLYHNNGNTNHWFLLKLVGTTSNRAAIGAKVRLQATIFGRNHWQMREIGGANRSQNDLRAHFGLGDATKADVVRVEWPSGHVDEMHDVAANQILTVQEPPSVKCVSWDGSAMCLAITGNIGERYELRTSTDLALPLANWEPWLTITNISKTMLVTNTSPLAPQRFHTAVPTQ
jgi:hypothetical protein